MPLSLDGKANQLAAMVRGNLGAALQGFVVIPLFAGYDTDAADPATAGPDRHLTTPPAAATRRSWATTRSAPARCSPAARSRSCTTPRRTWHGAVRTAVEALYDAADDDSATGGPDLIRHIYPVVVSITGDGAVRRPGRRHRPRSPRPWWPAAPRGPAADALRAPAALLPCAPWSRPVTMPFYSSLDQLLRDRSELRPQGHRPRPQRRGAHLRRRRAVRRGEPLAVAAQGLGDLRPDRVRGRRPVQRVREPAHRRRPARRRPRLLLRPARRHRPLAGQRLRPVPRALVLRAAEAVRGRAVRRRGRGGAARATSSTGSPTTARSRTSRSSW